VVQHACFLHLRTTHDILWLPKANLFHQFDGHQYHKVSAWRRILLLTCSLLGLFKLATIFQFCAKMGCKLRVSALRPLFQSFFETAESRNTSNNLFVHKLQLSYNLAFCKGLLQQIHWQNRNGKIFSYIVRRKTQSVGSSKQRDKLPFLAQNVASK
jgi:hypothetical protein